MASKRFTTRFLTRDPRPPTPTVTLPTLPGNFAVGIDDYWSEDELDIEEDDEFRKRKLLHDKKTRQAEKVWSIEDDHHTFLTQHNYHATRWVYVSPKMAKWHMKECLTRVSLGAKTIPQRNCHTEHGFMCIT